MASLFISYSRKDIEIARKLTGAFKGREVDFWIDWEGIPPTVDWWREIQKGIEETDVFLFLLSPDSCQSNVCRQEIEHAVKNGKRLIPIVVRNVTAGEAPSELRPLNWIFLREEDNFRAAFSKLMQAIKTDYAWVQAHRQLQVKALEWERSSFKKDFLLHGEELKDAELQLARNSAKEPHPTELQGEYVLKSREATDKQRRVVTSISVAGVIVLAALAVIAFVQAGLARRQAAIALSRQLSARAQTELLADNDRRLSMLFALEAIHTAKAVTGFENLDAEQVLRDAMYQTGGEMLLSPVGDPVLTTPTGSAALTAVQALSPSGDWLAIAYQDHTVHLWDLNSRQKEAVILPASKQDTLNKLLFDPQERVLVGLKYEGGVEIWDVKNPTRDSRVFHLKLGPIPSSDYSGDPTFSPDGHWLALHCIEGPQGPYTAILDLTDPNAQPLEIPGTYRVAPGLQGHWLLTVEQSNGIFSAGLWDLNDLAKGAITLTEEYYCLNFMVSPDAHWLATNCDNSVWVWDIQDPLNPKPGFDPLPNASLGAFSADSTHLAIIDVLGRVAVLDLLDSKDRSPAYFFSQGKSLRDLMFSADGQRLAATSGGTSILVWDLASQTSLRSTLNGLGGIEKAAQEFAFTSDNRHLISLSDDGVARKWDLWNPYADSFSPGESAHGIPYLDAISFNPDGHWLAMVDENRFHANPYYAIVNLQSLSADPITLPLSDGPLLFSTTGDLVISVSQQEKLIQRWNTADLAAGNLHPSSFEVYGRIIASHLDDRWLVTQLEDHTVQVWDIWKPETPPKSIPVQETLNDPPTLITNGQWLWLAGKDNPFQLWDLDHPEQKPETVSSLAAGTEFKVSPGGNWLASADHNVAQLWDLKRSPPQLIANIQTDTGFGAGRDEVFAFSPDEHWLVVSEGSKIQLLSLQAPTAQPVALTGMVAEMQMLAFSADSRWLAASGANGEIRIWNVQDLASAPVVLHEAESVQAMRFSPDGRWLAVVGLNKLVLQRLDIDELSALACEIIGSNLSHQQWKENFPAGRTYEKTCPRRPDGQDKHIRIMTG